MIGTRSQGGSATAASAEARPCFQKQALVGRLSNLALLGGEKACAQDEM
jgi:hypothetical protein